MTYFAPRVRWNLPNPTADVIHTTPDYALFFKRVGIPLVSTFHNFVIDALILPTVREGDSLAVLEAMGSGLPVVASACSSLPERIEHGKGGYLCDIGDIDGFVKAIQNLSDSQLRHRQGEFNRDRAEKEFSLTRMTRRYERLFSDL